ncbi:hypothetical protein PPERSA_11470 [Pseudocohnilembus persalinus]|uniref:Uncharacterized protein n=1 Tax=Pseudocohnilembus persalinus TaxID=266149 RepID=A0A0V0QWP8_PSEPJ|nr:hypothetical protein PPERSA_11470 [Pseudocohnilembus persalinus]|eukprot:KRX06825.1 hypothetical protein PPERSA_11470 [Pseudocohnilembus persalinus]
MFGYFLNLPEETQLNCSKINNQNLESTIFGGEDIIKLTENIGLISSSDRVKYQQYQQQQQKQKQDKQFSKNFQGEFQNGKLSFINLESGFIQEAKIFDFPGGKKFQPHGVYYESKSRELFVINHAEDGKGDYIEEFWVQISGKNMKDIKITYKYSYLVDAELTGVFNDVIKISHSQILVTGTAGRQVMAVDGNLEFAENQQTGIMLDAFLNRKKSVVYSCYIDQDCLKQNKQAVCEPLPNTNSNFNNGISWDLKNKVLVANSLDRTVTSYQLNLKDKNKALLEKKEVIQVTGIPDNINYDEKKQMFYVAGSIKQVDFLKFNSANIENKISWQNTEDKTEWTFVDQIKPLAKNFKFQVKNLFMQESPLTGVSVTLLHGENLYLGSWYDKGIAQCKIE